MPQILAFVILPPLLSESTARLAKRILWLLQENLYPKIDVLDALAIYVVGSVYLAW